MKRSRDAILGSVICLSLAMAPNASAQVAESSTSSTTSTVSGTGITIIESVTATNEYGERTQSEIKREYSLSGSNMVLVGSSTKSGPAADETAEPSY